MDYLDSRVNLQYCYNLSVAFGSRFYLKPLSTKDDLFRNFRILEDFMA